MEYCCFDGEAFSSIRFHSIWPTCVELCACTSDHKHSTRTSKASMSHNPKPRLVLALYSCLCERSLS